MLDVPGEIHIEVCGDNLTQLNNEPGAHRLQRVPPTERRGRVHTSTVTVAVINTDQFTKPDYSTIHENDLKIEWYSGTGAGGQNRNKVKCSCRLTHIPSGIVKTAQTRSRENSYKEAHASLVLALQQDASRVIGTAKSKERTQQMGNGSNSNVVRHYCFQHGFVKNTRGNKISIEQFERGCIDNLW